MKLRTSPILFYLLPGLTDILWLGAFYGALGLGPRMMNVDGDLGRHLTIGRYIIDHGKIPLEDIFSHTMTGQPVTPHEWLAQVLFALVERFFGLNGVILFCAVVIATAFWLVYRQSRAESKSVLPSVLVVVLGIAASSLHWLSRPHLFTFVMLALWVRVLYDLRSGHLRRWWLLLVIMLAWANLHGAFIAGFVTWLVYGLGLAWDMLLHRFQKGEYLHGHFWRYYLVSGLAALFITLLNPSGFELWRTSFGYIGNRYMVSHTMEYLPPNFHDPSTWPFLIFIGLLIGGIGLRNRRVEASSLFVTVVWLVMALYSVRNVPLFVIVSAPLLAKVLTEIMADLPHRVKFINRVTSLDAGLLHIDLSLRGVIWPFLGIFLALVCLQSGLHLDFDQKGNMFDRDVFPVEALDWLEDHPQPGEMFNYFPWGGYLLYRQWPERRVFIDGQTDFYGEVFTRQYEEVISMSEGWEKILDQYHVSWVILPPGEILASALQGESGWLLVYSDQSAVILQKIK